MATDQEVPQDLTVDALHRLLARLDPDPEEAGHQYERIRRKLIRLFEWRKCSRAEELADVVMDRVARRLTEGLEIRSIDPYRYFAGVAFRVYKEYLREEKRQGEMLDPVHWPEPVQGPPSIDEEDPRVGWVRDCLAELEAEDRTLLLQYLEGEKQGRIRNRKRLARELGVGMSTLRVRVHRLRKRIEDCVAGRASGDEIDSPSSSPMDEV